MNFNKKNQELTDQNIAKTYKMEIVIGEDRTLDSALLQQIENIALSSMDFSSGEKDFFLKILKQPGLEDLEDWQSKRFIKLAEKVNVKITFSGKPQLQTISTDETRHRLITVLKDSYVKSDITKLFRIFENSSRSHDISEANVNLVNVSTEQSFSNTDENESSESIRNVRMQSSYEQVYGKREDFPLLQLFSPLKKTEINFSNTEIENVIPSRILITGWAGSGKTVLSQYLTVMWARDVQDTTKCWWLDDTKVVISIKLRNLTKYDPKYCCLGEVVRRECFGIEDSKDMSYPSTIQIEADLEALGDKVVLILDGFDEVAEWYEEYEKNLNQSLTPRSELLKFELLGNRHRHRCILTSRPNQLEKLKYSFDRKLATIGFKDTDIKKYIKKYFHDKPYYAETVLENMRRNNNLWGIAHIPINLALICLMNQEREEKSVVLDSMTITDLYCDSILWLLRRDWEKHPIWNEADLCSRTKRLESLGVKTQNLQSLDEKEARKEGAELSWEYFEVKLNPYSTKISLLEEVAWRAEVSEQQNLLISGEVLVECLKDYYSANLLDSECHEILAAVKTLGFLDSQYHENEKHVKDNYYYFPHLTFQEYFAAKYWVRKFCSEKREDKESSICWFYRYKYHPRFEVVWWFVSGLMSKFHQNRLKDFLYLFKNSPRDVTGLKEIGLLIRCLEECSLVQLEVNNIEPIIDDIVSWVKWLINRDSSLYSVLYDHINQSPHVFSYNKITQFLIIEINSINDFSNVKFYKLLRFFGNVPAKNIDVMMTLLNMLDYASDNVHVRLITGAIKESSFNCLNDNETKYFVEKLLSQLTNGNSFQKMGSLKICQLLPIEILGNEQVENLIRCYIEAANESESETQQALLGAIDRLLRSQLFQNEHESRTNLINCYFKFIESSDQVVAYKAFELLSTLMFDKIDENLLSVIVECCEKGLLGKRHWARRGAIMLLPLLPWGRLKEKQNAMFEAFTFVLSDKQRLATNSRPDQIRLTGLQVFSKFPWNMFDQEITDKLMQCCIDMIGDIDPWTSFQAVEEIGRLLSNYQLGVASIEKLVEYCIRELPSSSQSKRTMIALNVIPKVILYVKDDDTIVRLILACLDKLDDKSQKIQITAKKVVKAIEWKKLPQAISLKLIECCRDKLKSTELPIIIDGIELVPLALEVISNSNEAKILSEKCLSLLKGEKSDLSLKLKIVEIFSCLFINSETKRNHIQDILNICLVGLENKDQYICELAIDGLHGLPWNMLNETQVEKLFSIQIETLTRESPTREKALNVFVKYLLKYLSRNSLESLINRCIVELENQNILRRQSYTSILTRVPEEIFSIKQIQEIVRYCLKNGDSEDFKNHVFSLLNTIPWWKFFEERYPNGDAEGLEYAIEFLKYCVYAQVNAYYMPEKNSVCIIDIHGRDLLIKLNVDIQSIIFKARDELHLPSHFITTFSAAQKKQVSSSTKSRFSFRPNKDDLSEDDHAKVKSDKTCIIF